MEYVRNQIIKKKTVQFVSKTRPLTLDEAVRDLTAAVNRLREIQEGLINDLNEIVQSPFYQSLL